MRCLMSSAPTCVGGLVEVEGDHDRPGEGDCWMTARATVEEESSPGPVFGPVGWAWLETKWRHIGDGLGTWRSVTRAGRLPLRALVGS